MEHRLVMENKIGRYLTENETVHHINGVKDDNRPENLMLFSGNGEHISFHNANLLALKKRIRDLEEHVRLLQTGK